MNAILNQTIPLSPIKNGDVNTEGESTSQISNANKKRHRASKSMLERKSSNGRPGEGTETIQERGKY